VNAQQTFVIIFRQGPPSPTEFDKQRRAEETVPWAQSQNSAGHNLNPYILAPESVHQGPKNSAVEDDAWPVTALLFLEALDLSEATRVAESHPALRYGASVEVRPWASPVPPALQPT
jgi:hypothetical protein